MAGGGAEGERQLDHTPTWAVAIVCFVIVLISILMEKGLHKLGEWFRTQRRKALFEALEKIEAELMVLGFISLLLTFGQNYIADICIPIKVADTMLPCLKEESQYLATKHYLFEDRADRFRRLLSNHQRRILAAGSPGPGCKEGYVPLISLNGLHQLHIFIFFLAVFHVFYSAITMLLGKLKIRKWKEWEQESAQEFEMMNDPKRFRLTHQTSFVKSHANVWMRTSFTFYIICFFRQFFRSVRKADYLTMRHGFITVHLAPGCQFDFQKYIKRSLEDDFKVVVGISPVLWASMVVFLLLNVHGWAVMYVITIMPLIVILAVGTKLQGIISQMALEIQERHSVIQGIPLVQVSDSYFWFSWPELVLHLIHFVLFQNAFEITYFLWIWYEFGLKSCFHDDFLLSSGRIVLGLAVQFLCSYSTLPLYALVTQMGSTMKKSIFDEETSKAIRQWHRNAVRRTMSRQQHTSRTFSSLKSLKMFGSKNFGSISKNFGSSISKNFGSFAYSNHSSMASVGTGDHGQHSNRETPSGQQLNLLS